MNVLIIGGGSPPSTELLLKECERSDFIICADRGGEYLKTINKLPNLLLGDFDSIDKATLDYYIDNGVTLERFPVRKDYTDTEICLRKAIALKPKEVVFIACTGTRLDHVMGNIGLLRELLINDIQGYIKDDNNIIFLIKESTIINGKPGQIISFQAFSDKVDGFTISGVQYPLNNFTLRPWSTLTVSNVFKENKVRVSFKEGILMIILPKD